MRSPVRQAGCRLAAPAAIASSMLLAQVLRQGHAGLGASGIVPFLIFSFAMCAKIRTMFSYSIEVYKIGMPLFQQSALIRQRPPDSTVLTPRPGKSWPNLPKMALAHEVAKRFGSVRSVCARPPLLYKGHPLRAGALQTNVMPSPPDRRRLQPSPRHARTARGDQDVRTIRRCDSRANVAPGDFVTVVGAQRCGKSTLFNIVAGLDEPDTAVSCVSKAPAATPSTARSRLLHAAERPAVVLAQCRR